MTAKERQQFQRLEAENRMLRAQLDKRMEFYRDQMIEIIELKATLELIRSAMNGDTA